MTRWKNKVFSLLSAFMLSVIIGSSAFADDLEIYLGAGNTHVTYNPNVLFIIDTSGSMASKDDSDLSRMQKVQNALRSALKNATNINAGLMRFSDHGGPILFPVKGIDDPLAPELIIPTREGKDDASEIAGIIDIDHNHLVLTNGTKTAYTGLRFTEVNIPRGAVITSAKLRFTSANMNTGSSKLSIYAEKTGNAESFSQEIKNISKRARSTNFVEWTDENNFPLSEEVINSPDISHVIQEIIDGKDWCGGNALAIIIEGSSTDGASKRESFANDEGSSRSPQLVIKYDESTATGCVRLRRVYQVDQQDANAEEKGDGYQATGSELTFDARSNSYIGIRFKDIALPQGAKVQNAYLEFTAYQNATSKGAQMRIRGLAEDEPADFSADTRYLLKNIVKTTANVSWTNIPAWYRNNAYQSPPVTKIVQEIVNQSGWSPKNEMMFVFDNFTNAKRGAYTFKGKPSGAARLVIEFEGNATPGTSATVRDHLMSKVDELNTNGHTPIVDTLYEASLYYGGLGMDYGRQRGPSSVSNSVRRSTRVSHRSSYLGADPIRPVACFDNNLSDSACVGEYIPLGANYISPVKDRQCQVNNHIVLLSDGEANNNHSVEKIEALLGKSCTVRGRDGEKCGLDLVKSIADIGETPIGARVITHTIGFATNNKANNFLNQLALNSGGSFYSANDSESLLEAFDTILRQVKDLNTSFVSPSVAVNQLNRLTHRDELYFALFKPQEGTLWPGNLKKYRIQGDTIVDKNGLAAVDSASGFFSENSHSFWSPTTDGNDVRVGGAISRLDLIRNIYSFDDQPGQIFKATNKLDENNLSISTIDLAINNVSGAENLRKNLLKWARGVDVLDDDGDGSTTDINLMMGDPIHSQPAIVNYSLSDSAIFVATNHGFLHSFDAESGEENFAIIPRELLSNLIEFYNKGSSFNHIYGLDGDLVLRKFDDKTYLYVGMRRGGNNYYAFDVTEKTNPKLVFKIVGGSAPFENLGQTWSRPIVAKIDAGKGPQDVLIFAGGYDVEQDDKIVKSPERVGNSVFIVDANNGNLLWSASNEAADLNIPQMQYSIPARVAVIDRDYDGLADHLYVVDMGAQVFRIDIYNGQGRAELAKGALLATLGGDDDINNRRFYYAPDVSEIALGEERFYAVAVGSGFRAGPLNTSVQDYFYMLKDEGVFMQDKHAKFMFPTQAYKPSDLYDATLHQLTAKDEIKKSIANTDFANKKGWMLELQSGGEKVLASPLIVDYKIFFTTYLPSSANKSLCAPPTGNSRAYLINLFNANAVIDLDQDGLDEHTDRYAQLSQTGIAPDTKILIENIVQPVVCLGAECVSAVIDVDEDGKDKVCDTDLECLAQNIYGRFQRVRKDTWKTEIENK